MTEHDHYAVLDIGRYSSQDEIRDAYRRLARELHPDRTGGDPAKAERFKRVSLAYRALSAPETRQTHDEALDAAEGPGGKLLGLAEELLGADGGKVCERIRHEGITRENFEEVASAFVQAARITHGRLKDKVAAATAAREGKPNDLFSIVSELLS